ncbi:MAG TPA: hypothetical protein VKX96_12265 [Chloroflexota bacterium]|nr:hypothetical protein [Chloroflexota bacterium]
MSNDLQRFLGSQQAGVEARNDVTVAQKPQEDSGENMRPGFGLMVAK